MHALGNGWMLDPRRLEAKGIGGLDTKTVGGASNTNVVKKQKMQINRRMRFKVLNRDGFSCQYCGRKAPEVRLEVDHITAKTKGGTDLYSNLITACLECNRGKDNLEVTTTPTVAGIPEEEYAEKKVKHSPVRTIRLANDVYEELKARKPRGISWDYLFRGFLNLPT